MRLAAAIVFAGLLCCAAAADSVRPPPSRQVGWFDGSPSWSPDGSLILFGSQVEPPKESPDHRLGLVRPDGTGFRILSRPRSDYEVWDQGASFSPDGRTLLLTRVLGMVDPAVVVKDVVSGSERRLTPANAQERAGNWSPDGSRVIVIRIDDDKGTWTPFTERPDASDARQLAPPGRALFANYLPGGTIVINRFEKGTATVTTIPSTGGSERAVAPVGNWNLAGWSPDGKRLLLVRRSATVETDASLWTVDVDGSNLHRLVSGDDGAWSPDGSRIAYTPSVYGRDHGIYVIAADGGVSKRIVRNGRAPAWSPSGGLLAFAYAGPCTSTGIYVIAPGASTTRRLTNDCRIVGTPRDDLLLGTRDRDVIRGLGGNDTIRANPGNYGPVYYGIVDYDDVDGGPGNDTIFGGRGLDFLYGGPGRDRIFGGRGADRIYGGPGADLLDGGPYKDRIYATDGARDVVRCGGDVDRVVADRFDILIGCERVTRR